MTERRAGIILRAVQVPDYLAEHHDLSICGLPLDKVGEAMASIAAQAAGQ